MEGLGPVAAAAAAFVGTHFLLSHPLRKPIVDTVGSAAFLGIYSVVAAATLGWLALAYRAALAGGATPLAEVLRRNAYGGRSPVDDATVARLAAYVRRQVVRLADTPRNNLTSTENGPSL